ncbi:4-hydroxyphenylacetate 3-monooxygenase reductase component [compost metagenome]
MLCGEQEELARHFAGMTQVPMAERFAWDLWDDGAADVPVLRDALVQLEGRISECKEVGSHSVMFVELTKVGVREPRDSLVYFNRLFHRLEHVGAHC